MLTIILRRLISLPLVVVSVTFVTFIVGYVTSLLISSSKLPQGTAL